MDIKDNKLKRKAAALRYSPGDIAPKVVARGAGTTAEKILLKAEENNVTVYKNPKLAEELNMIDIGDSIPPELYEVVAQILVFIDKIDRLEAENHAYR